ncbi:hypothetical protein K502DRAFT_330257 [Neoconidiobolus thromboides FSU 785]|nr:hypothetical protein K502DRAFT_330257 [Neoconidiobolus thromboides FSU 785]
MNSIICYQFTKDTKTNVYNLNPKLDYVNQKYQYSLTFTNKKTAIVVDGLGLPLAKIESCGLFNISRYKVIIAMPELCLSDLKIRLIIPSKSKMNAYRAEIKISSQNSKQGVSYYWTYYSEEGWFLNSSKDPELSIASYSFKNPVYTLFCNTSKELNVLFLTTLSFLLYRN